jgi:hypothetical protein
MDRMNHPARQNGLPSQYAREAARKEVVVGAEDRYCKFTGADQLEVPLENCQTMEPGLPVVFMPVET